MQDTWKWIAGAIVLLAILLLFGWFILKTMGYDGVVTNTLKGWLGMSPV